jgi:hypothetical protein
MSPTKLILTAACLFSASLLHAQLLTNPGFEQGLDGWQNSEKTPVSSAIPEAAHEGKLGLRVNDNVTDGGAYISSDRFDVSPGQTVTLSFWARSPHKTLAAVMITPYDSNKRAILNENGKHPVVVAIKKSDEWEFYQASYTVVNDAVTVGFAIRSWSGSTGTADFDDFQLKIE